MVWFKKEMDYARESLEEASESAIERAGDKLGGVVRDGIAGASGELKEVLLQASQEVDAKLDKISTELHNQRSFTKTDIKEMVDYAAEKLGATIDDRVHVMKTEITALVEEKVEYLKSEVDTFFMRRQQDLARERRRLMVNIMIAVGASVMMAAVSLMYHRAGQYQFDPYTVFRIVFGSLVGGWGAYLLFSFFRRYRRMSEHEKDVFYVSMRYWGVLHPESVFGQVVLLLLLLVLGAVLLFPDEVARLSGSEMMVRWAEQLRGIK
jgi:hypothetical protein